jgi:hypothetical protein
MTRSTHHLNRLPHLGRGARTAFLCARMVLLCGLALLLLGLYAPAVFAQGFTPDVTRRPNPGDPPNTLLIGVSAPDERGRVTVSGSPNSVYPLAYLAVRNLHTYETRFTQAGIGGAFSATLTGAADTPFLIMPSPVPWPENVDRTTYPGALPGGPGAIVTGESRALSPTGPVAFTTGGTLAGDRFWTAEGTTPTLRPAPGQPWEVALTVRFREPNPPNLAIGARLVLEPVLGAFTDSTALLATSADADGSASGEAGFAYDEDIIAATQVEAVTDAFNQFEAAVFTLRFSVPADRLREGRYVPRLIGFTQSADGTRTLWEAIGQRTPGAPYTTLLPVVVTVGQPSPTPLHVRLFADDPSGGARGLPVAAPGAGGDAAFTPLYVLPPLDGQEAPIEYALEPYLPDLLANRADRTTPPRIPFDFAASRYSIVVTPPRGRQAEYAGRFYSGLVSSDAPSDAARFGTTSPIDPYRLSTLNPDLFRRVFSEQGDYLIRVEIVLNDRFGNSYRAEGEAVVTLAQPLVLTPALLAGTPVVHGSAIDPSVHIAPAVPAEVTLNWSVGEPARVRAMANAHGIAHMGEPLVVEGRAPVWRFAYSARYTDPDGRLWAGSRAASGIVLAEAPLPADEDPSAVLVRSGLGGRRGLAAPAAAPDDAWYTSRRLLERAGLNPDQPVTAFYPFHPGDVLWLPDGADWAAHAAASRVVADPALADPAGADAPLAVPSALRLIMAASRPDAAVRTFDRVFDAAPGQHSPVQPLMLAGRFGEDAVWNTDDRLAEQVGAGFAGLRATDPVFILGGAAWEEAGVSRRAGYSALVIITDEEQARVMPPARGADGGPDGGPLVSIRGRAYDMFFHPTGVRPGDVLAPGDPIRISGYAAPLVAADVTAVITAPDGTTATVSGRANPFGLFYNPAADLVADQIGAWTVRVTTRFTGETRAGETTPPYPVGGVLGTTDDTFLFFVAGDRDALAWDDRLNDEPIPAVLPYNFNFTVPEGWGDARVYRVLATPGLTLETGELRLSGRSFTYQHRPVDLQRANPALEPETRVSGPSASDAKRLTLVITATGPEGEPVIAARTFTIWHDRLITLQPNADGGP